MPFFAAVIEAVHLRCDGSFLSMLSSSVTNVWILASNVGMYQVMLDMLTTRLEQAKMRWKPKSLEFMLVNHEEPQLKAKITVSSQEHCQEGVLLRHWTLRHSDEE